MKYSELVDSVRRRGALETAEQARDTTTAVLSTAAHSLDPADRRALASELPGSLDEAVLVPGQREHRSGSDLVIEVAQRLRTTQERARYLAKAVVDGLRDTDADVVERLRERLDSDLIDLLDAGGQPPQRARSVRAEVPTELSEEEVATALRGLTGWEGDHTGISRTVLLPEEAVTPLVNRVEREARAANDHAHVERVQGGVRFTLRTGRAAVTEPDIQLAERIDRIVEAGPGR